MIELDLFSLKARLEADKRREISWREIGQRIDVHENVLYRYVNNDVRRVDLDTLSALYDFFRAEGLDITIGDLFVVSER